LGPYCVGVEVDCIDNILGKLLNIWKVERVAKGIVYRRGLRKLRKIELTVWVLARLNVIANPIALGIVHGHVEMAGVEDLRVRVPRGRCVSAGHADGDRCNFAWIYACDVPDTHLSTSRVWCVVIAECT
jgi:hypothetical protein